MTRAPKSGVSIVIPTYKRVESLLRLLRSVKTDISGRDDVTIIVADNDPAGSAKACVDDFAAACSVPVLYRHAPDPGVSNARNAGMSAVKTDYVLFLDDDMEVIAPYLTPLLEASKSLGTALTFAPAKAQLPEGTEHLSEWLGPLFSRVTSGPSRVIDKTFGTGGCLVNLSDVTLPDPVFDPALNETGGEDDVFFAALLAQGVTIGWSADSHALEHVPAHRATGTYLWRRHFAFGQTPARDAAERGLKGLPATLKWMVVGATQCLIHAPLYGLNSVLNRPVRLHHLGRLAQGVGKMFWWDSLSPRLYGSNAR